MKSKKWSEYKMKRNIAWSLSRCCCCCCFFQQNIEIRLIRNLPVSFFGSAAQKKMKTNFNTSANQWLNRKIAYMRMTYVRVIVCMNHFQVTDYFHTIDKICIFYMIRTFGIYREKKVSSIGTWQRKPLTAYWRSFIWMSS